MKNIEESIGRAATKIATDIKADCIISIEKRETDESIPTDLPYMNAKVTFFKQVREGVYSKTEYTTKIKKISYGSTLSIKEILMEGINKQYIKKGDRVVCVQDESMGSSYKGLLFIFDVDKLFFDISTHNLAKDINPDVIESIIDLSQEIAQEGREGRKIGTAFIVGDRSEISGHIKQLIMNPFEGYPEESRKITNPSIRETIKNFAQLDGAFIIDKSGSIISAGAYINTDAKDVDLPPGFGTRHRCCAALTKETNATAIVVSASGGIIRIFKDGKIIMKL